MSKLRESNSFLNTIFENITSAIFLVDKNVNIQQFNETFKILFNKNESQIINNLCGNVIGCEYTVTEGKYCGFTSNCDKCQVRKAILKAFNKENTIKETVTRNFYINKKPIKKYFQFTTKHITYNNEDMVMLIFDDITQIESSKIELKKRNEIIELYNTRIKEDLSLARNIQQNIIPNILPKTKDLIIHAMYNPLEEIGGDLYDIIDIDEDNIGIFISDISGHGVAAAMITTMVKAIMQMSKPLYNNPEKLMDNLNKKLINLSENMYLTSFYGVYNKITKKLTYVRCGHPYPIIIRNEEFKELKEGGSLILGMFEDVHFENTEIILEDEDKLLFYTDGLIETKNEDGEDFSSEFEKILVKNKNKDIEEIIKYMYSELKEFKGKREFEDDICILGIQISASDN